MLSLVRSSLTAAGASALWATAYAGSVLAQGFGGPDPELDGTPGSASEGDVRRIITDVLNAVLNFLALVAVVVVVIAGIRLIISQGNEEQLTSSRKAIFYALIGLVIVLFARVIVGLVTDYLADEVV